MYIHICIYMRLYISPESAVEEPLRGVAGCKILCLTWIVIYIGMAIRASFPRAHTLSNANGLTCSSAMNTAERYAHLTFAAHCPRANVYIEQDALY